MYLESDFCDIHIFYLLDFIFHFIHFGRSSLVTLSVIMSVFFPPDFTSYFLTH